MSFLRKPYTPVVFTSATKEFNVYGKSFMRLEAVYLSGLPYENQTFYNPFSAVPKLSAHYPGFFGVKLPLTQYSTNFEDAITFTMPSATRAGYVDVIVQNPAGYGKLTQYVVKDLYSGVQALSTLRPWSLGIKVLTGVEIPSIPLPANLVYTFNTLSALQTFNGQGIVTFVVGLSDQMYSINNDTITTIQGNNIVEI